MGKLKIVVVLLLIFTVIGVGAVVGYNLLYKPDTGARNTSQDKSIVVSNLSINRNLEDASTVDAFGIVNNNSQTKKSVILRVTLKDTESGHEFTGSIAVENIAPKSKKVFTVPGIKGYADSKSAKISADVVDVLPVQE